MTNDLLELFETDGNYEGMVLYEYPEAFIGIMESYTHESVVVYDREKVIDILVVRDGMSRQEALEFYENNIIGQYVGPRTPVFITLKKDILDQL